MIPKVIIHCFKDRSFVSSLHLINYCTEKQSPYSTEVGLGALLDRPTQAECFENTVSQVPGVDLAKTHR